MSLANNGLCIEAIFFSRFEDIEGYSIAASDPANVLGETQFKEIGYHFLPDKSLSGNVVTLYLDQYRIVGCPVHLSGPQYTRSAFVFCIGFIVVNGSDDMSIYRRLARQLSVSFERLEVNMRFLSGAADDCGHGGVSLQLVASVLSEIRTQLNNPRLPYVYVPIDDRDALSFKPVYATRVRDAFLKPHYTVYPLVGTLDDLSLGPVSQDRLLQAVFAEIVSIRISAETFVAGIPVERLISLFPGEDVVTILACLMQSGAVVATAPITAQSRPALTPKARALFATNVGDRQELAEFVAAVTGESPSVHEVLKCLSLMDGRKSLSQISGQNLSWHQLVSLIVCSLSKDLVRLRRLLLVAKAPGATSGSSAPYLLERLPSSPSTVQPASPVKLVNMDVKLASLCDGKTDVAEIAANLEISEVELVTIADKLTHSFIKIWL